MNQVEDKTDKDGKTFRNEQKKRRLKGEDYLKRTSKTAVNSINQPPIEVSCHCRYHCKEISYEWRLKLFNDFHGMNDENAQGTYLLGYLEAVDIKRRRNGKYEVESDSHRQCTVNYRLPTSSGDVIQVCKGMFQETLGVKHRFLQTMQERKKKGITIYRDKRGDNFRRYKYSNNDCTLVREHINSFPKDESHYGRAKSNRLYLSADLNINRMHRAFVEKYPEQKVSYKYYRKVFTKYFPNLHFHRPRVDTCAQCDLFNQRIILNNVDSTRAKTEQQFHHRKYKKAIAEMKKDHDEAKIPSNQFSVISIDLQQVIQLPSLTHSQMFYSRQLNVFNFGIHLADNDSAFMCLWHEAIASRGSNEIASSILKLVNDGHISRKNLIIWSDNCCGQNKNRTIIFLMVYLTSLGIFHEIQQKFVVKGHSFLSCDRDFAFIEKRKKVTKLFVLNDLIEMIKKARYIHPLIPVEMAGNDFFDLMSACDSLINTKKIPLSKISVIKVSASDPTKVFFKQTFSELISWEIEDVLVKGKTIEDLRKVLLSVKNKPKLSNDKKHDLKAMLPYLPTEAKDFYLNLIDE